jgi:hypothetical protein
VAFHNLQLPSLITQQAWRFRHPEMPSSSVTAEITACGGLTLQPGPSSLSQVRSRVRAYVGFTHVCCCALGGGPDSCGDTDGPSKDATLCRPVGAAYDRNGDLLVGATVIWHPASADEILSAVFVMAACHGAYTPESGDCGHTIRRLTADGPGPPGAVKCP